MVTRFISGTFAAAPLTVSPHITEAPPEVHNVLIPGTILQNGGGMMVDLWPNPTDRGQALTFFWTLVFLGPLFGPIVGAFVDQSYLGWRWVVSNTIELCLFSPN